MSVPRSDAPSERMHGIVAGIDTRASHHEHIGPPGAVTITNEHFTWRDAQPDRDYWVVVISPDKTCAFAYAGRYFPEENGGTQRLMHWAVVWSEPPAAHTMWARQWARFARVRKGSSELRPEGLLCRICRTRDPEKCEGIRRAHRALSIALLGRKVRG